MKPTILNTEQKIHEAAKKVFLKYGFHGTKLQQVAETANVNKSVIHYYYRTKVKLYKAILRNIILYIESADFTDKNSQEENLKVKWFLFSEIYNNKCLLENTVKELYPSQCREKLQRLLVLFDIEQIF